ncbi:MAG: hypothetical protein H6855_06320 [Rhodospirillales bacterium]|nr:hypothetical protein [Rhodospirillales bacterium]MCB9965678.1 hypothetical protein [Rhodospirillales bacterium]
MSKSTAVFLFLLPALITLGHDAWYYYEHQDEGVYLSDLGWLWTTYHPESHDALFKEVGEEKWGQYFVPILSMPSVLVALILSSLITLVILLFKGLKSTGGKKFKGQKSQGARGLGRDRGAQSQFKYKRK